MQEFLIKTIFEHRVIKNIKKNRLNSFNTNIVIFRVHYSPSYGKFCTLNIIYISSPQLLKTLIEIGIENFQNNIYYTFVGYLHHYLFIIL